MDTPIEGIGQIHITVSDVQRAISFYRDQLGLEFLFEVPGQEMAFLQCGGIRLYLGRAESPDVRSNPMLYYSVSSIETAHAKLSERGVEFTHPPHIVHRTDSMELWMAGFSDSEGNQACLMSEVPTST